MKFRDRLVLHMLLEVGLAEVIMREPKILMKAVMGITDVNYVRGQQALAVVDSSLA